MKDRFGVYKYIKLVQEILLRYIEKPSDTYIDISKKWKMFWHSPGCTFCKKRIDPDKCISIPGKSFQTVSFHTLLPYTAQFVYHYHPECYEKLQNIKLVMERD